MAKKSTLSHSASNDNSKNDSEHSAHSNTLRKKNKSNTSKGKSKSKSRGAGTRVENWSVAQTTFLVHLYGNNMLSPELPLKLPAWNIIVAAIVKQHPERKESCSRRQVKALWLMEHAPVPLSMVRPLALQVYKVQNPCPTTGRLWWMYQHTFVSAAPACGVGVPIRSHVQALW
ncbi:BQ5605_C051g12548 [Microbotryum silenes-dioicae]|uniref:BQ5605_C051g12548 protein n=1 Tax=Microbotryum silenes-dioicae TaxID=796604 RepID=A0A2X0PH81_9BASI|nr:BQ5605_C051g12548 [Microbotryum silenes-dioicae]